MLHFIQYDQRSSSEWQLLVEQLSNLVVGSPVPPYPSLSCHGCCHEESGLSGGSPLPRAGYGERREFQTLGSRYLSPWGLFKLLGLCLMLMHVPVWRMFQCSHTPPVYHMIDHSCMLWQRWLVLSGISPFSVVGWRFWCWNPSLPLHGALSVIHIGVWWSRLYNTYCSFFCRTCRGLVV